MLVLEFKCYGKQNQYQAIDEAIRTGQFIRNKCLRLWMDTPNIGRYDLNKYCKVLADEFPFAKDLNSMARQSSAERAWSSISRFYDNCKRQIPGKKADATPRRRQAQGNAHQAGFPKFKKFSRSVEYKTTGWKLSPDIKWIKFTDKKGIGKLKLKGTWELWRYDQKLIKRVRLVRRADGYYVQFCVSLGARSLGEFNSPGSHRKVDVVEPIKPSGQTVGLDVGLKEFYTDSRGGTQSNPRFYRQGERRIKFYQKRVSRKKKGSSNRIKAINKLGRTHLKISRQREEHAKKLARCVIHSNDVVAYEDLRIRNLVKNHCLAKSINDAGWYQFRKWLEYFGKKFGKVTVAVNPAYTSQNCSSCGEVVKKSLSTRTHVCLCGCELDRDHNAAINILERALGTVGHTGTRINNPNASGDLTATVLADRQVQQVGS